MAIIKETRLLGSHMASCSTSTTFDTTVDDVAKDDGKVALIAVSNPEIINYDRIGSLI